MGKKESKFLFKLVNLDYKSRKIHIFVIQIDYKIKVDMYIIFKKLTFSKEVWLTIIPEEMALKQAFTLHLRGLRSLRETLRNFGKLHPA